MVVSLGGQANSHRAAHSLSFHGKTKWEKESSWVKTGRALVNCYCEWNWLDIRKISVNLYSIKWGADSKKWRQPLMPHLLLLPGSSALFHSCILPSSTGRMGSRRLCGQHIMVAPLSAPSSFYTFPLLQHDHLTNCSSFRESPSCLEWPCPRAATWISAVEPGVPAPPPSLTFMFTLLFLTGFIPFSSVSMASFAFHYVHFLRVTTTLAARPSHALHWVFRKQLQLMMFSTRAAAVLQSREL